LNNYDTREAEIDRRCTDLETSLMRDGLRERETRLLAHAGSHPAGDGPVSPRTLAALAAFVAVGRERDHLENRGIEA